jgi:hypothetical protein
MAIDEINESDFDERLMMKRQRQLALKICKDLCLFMIFLTAFTTVALLSHSSESALLVRRILFLRSWR